MYNIFFPRISFYSTVGNGTIKTSCRQEIYRRFMNHLGSKTAIEKGPRQTFIYNFSRDRFRYPEYKGHLERNLNSISRFVHDYFKPLSNIIRIGSIKAGSNYKSEFIKVNITYINYNESRYWVKIVTTWARNFTSFLDPVIYNSVSYSYNIIKGPAGKLNFDTFYFMSAMGRYDSEAAIKLGTIINIKNDAFKFLFRKPIIGNLTDIFNKYSVYLYKYYFNVINSAIGIAISKYHLENAAYSDNSFYSDIAIHYIVKNYEKLNLQIDNIGNFYRFYNDNKEELSDYDSIIDFYNAIKYRTPYDNIYATDLINELKNYIQLL